MTRVSTPNLEAGHVDPQDGNSDLLERILQRSSRLYTLPAVAMDVLKLTDDPRVNAAELTACIQRDPAITAKILRVVNSSLYGLSAEVGNLGQAVALLGIKPLKLLVLGFSLPSDLFAELAGEQLERYWATALVRAVAAKAIAERFYRFDGDDAFVAGLIDDIGMLAMLGSLGEPYARFLQVVWEQEGDVRAVERDALGFDHSHLTSALLAQWKMPQSLVRAAASVGQAKKLKSRTSDDPLPQILYLAGLMAGLVGRHRLNVLPELIEAGTNLCGMNKPALNSIVEELEPKVDALADALQVRLPKRKNYLEILAEAQARMAELGENLAGPLSRLERAEQLLADLNLDDAASPDKPAARRGDARPTCNPQAPGRPDEGDMTQHAGSLGHRALAAALEKAAADCRATRDELVMVLIDLHPSMPTRKEPFPPPVSMLSGLLARVCREFGVNDAEQFHQSGSIHALVLPHCTRREAIELVRHVFANLEGRPDSTASTTHGYSAGMASVDAPPRNFDPLRLIESAQRCLSAAQASGGQIKSLEIC